VPDLGYCSACGAKVLRVLSHKHRWFFVDAEPYEDGCFALDGHLAKYLPAPFNPETTNRYRPHKPWCMGKGKKAQTEALQRTLARAREGL
jgi:hypothetical protein